MVIVTCIHDYMPYMSIGIWMMDEGSYIFQTINFPGLHLMVLSSNMGGFGAI